MSFSVRLVNPSYSGTRRGERSEHLAHKHHYRRRHNPFSAGGIAPLATKVAGGLLGGIGAAVIPNMLGSTMGSGWAGVIAALVVAFAGSYVTKGMSPNLSEGVLIGGTLQAAGRIAQLTVGKNLVSFSLSGYGPMSFPVPTPGYSQVPALIPAGSTATSPAKGGAMSGAPRTRGMKWAA